MPKLIDWGSRNGLICEAVVRLAAAGGATAVSIESVAAELQVSGSTLRRGLASPDRLGEMGVRWITRSRRSRYYGGDRPRPAPAGVVTVEMAMWWLVPLLPRDREEVAEERAWVQLTHPGADEACRQMREDHEAYLDDAIRRLLEAFTGREDVAVDCVHLRAVVDGLNAALCRGSVTLAQAQACLAAHLRLLPGRSGDELSPGAA